MIEHATGQLQPLYIVKVMCNVGPTVLVFGMGFLDADDRDLRAEHFRAAMEGQVASQRMQIFNVQHVGGSCTFFGHQIAGVVCETYTPEMGPPPFGAGMVMQ